MHNQVLFTVDLRIITVIINTVNKSLGMIHSMFKMNTLHLFITCVL